MPIGILMPDDATMRLVPVFRGAVETHVGSSAESVTTNNGIVFWFDATNTESQINRIGRELVVNYLETGAVDLTVTGTVVDLADRRRFTVCDRHLRCGLGSPVRGQRTRCAARRPGRGQRGRGVVVESSPWRSPQVLSGVRRPLGRSAA